MNYFQMYFLVFNKNQYIFYKYIVYKIKIVFYIDCIRFLFVPTRNNISIHKTELYRFTSAGFDGGYDFIKKVDAVVKVALSAGKFH